MKAITFLIVTFLLAGISFSQDNCKPKFEMTLSGSSVNTTPIMNTPEGKESSNFNMQTGALSLTYTPKKSAITYGIKLGGFNDSYSSGFFAAMRFMTKNFRIDAGGGLMTYKSNVGYRDSANAKDREGMWYLSGWTGSGMFESWVTVMGNTNSLRYVEANAMLYPTKFFGIGARLEKNWPRNMNLYACTELVIHKVPGIEGLTATLYAAGGGYGENGKVVFTGSFGGTLSLNFSITGK